MAGLALRLADPAAQPGLDGGRGVANSLFLFNVQQDGTYPFRLLWENGNGSFALGNLGSVEWFSVLPDGTKVLVNSATNSSAIKAYRAAAAALRSRP